MTSPAALRWTIVLHALSAVAMAVFVWFFISRNQPGLTGVPVIAGLGVVYCLCYALASPRLFGGAVTPLSITLARCLYAATLVSLPLLFLNATVWDYYQPLSLFDDAIAALAIAWLLLLAALLLALLSADGRLQGAALVALLAAALPSLVYHVSDPQPAAGLALHRDIFTGGREGYDIYRIPALLVLPAGSKLADGTVLHSDRLLAIAEARRDGALDTGVIDLVQKSSDDGGESWSQQQVICSHHQNGARGKCGNATPLFDSDSGTLWLAYNLSGIPGDLPEGPRVHSAHLMHSLDGGGSWQDPLKLPFGNLVFGPGHGIRKHLPPAQGRLLLPAYRAGSAMVIYSDDHGVTWRKGGELGWGNETEVAELADGRLYMVTRHNAPIGRAPQPNGRLYAYSGDGGLSWPANGLDTVLPTPVCQASVVSAAGGQLLFANPAHSKARVRMTIRASDDNGVSWQRGLQVYPGPAGYSQLGVLGSGEIVLLYERGRMAYSERISFARVSPAQFVARE